MLILNILQIYLLIIPQYRWGKNVHMHTPKIISLLEEKLDRDQGRKRGGLEKEMPEIVLGKAKIICSKRYED